jgi:hypothetical protein
MIKSKFQIENNGFVLLNDRMKQIPKIVFIFFISIAFLIPIIATVISISSADGMKFGIVLTFILFWGSGVYMTRVLLWNVYGREVFLIGKGRLNYYVDYKYFKDNSKDVDLSEATFFIKPNKMYGEIFYTIQVTYQTGEISSSINLEEKDSILLKNELNEKWSIDISEVE